MVQLHGSIISTKDINDYSTKMIERKKLINISVVSCTSEGHGYKIASYPVIKLYWISC